jgi:site-specific DNA recombinase
MVEVMAHALLYIRVSTPKQGDDAYNLPTQTRKVEERCKRDGFSILKIFVDVESARTDDRPQFQAMLQYCRTHQGKVTHVVFADLSRLARNIEDQAATLAKFKKLKITPVSCDERIEDTAAGKLTVNLLGMVNQFYSDSLRERITFRMAAGVQEGRFLWLAPVGYINGPKKSGLKVDHMRSGLVVQAFEWVATRSYSLEEILRRINLLGLTTRRAGRPLTKQTMGRMLRNEIYAGWVVSGQHRVKGLHEPIVSQELFDAVQDALDGKSATHVIRKKLNGDFPLKGFVRCVACDKKLTAGLVKGRSQRYPRYWCWNTQCSAKVSASRDEIEGGFLGLLAMMQPTQEFINELPRIAKTHWAHRLERIGGEKKRLSTLLDDNRTLNQRILLQKVNGELSAEDFDTLKETVTKKRTDVEAQTAELDAEASTMDALLQETQNNIIDLVGAWNVGSVAARQELAFSLYPEGLRYSRETKYFEPGNALLVSTMREMVDQILVGKSVGAGDGI